VEPAACVSVNAREEKRIYGNLEDPGRETYGRRDICFQGEEGRGKKKGAGGAEEE